MASGGFYRGTTIDQDPRFKDKDRKLIESTSWPALFSEKVNLSKVQLPALAPWISQHVCDSLGIEDEILSNLVMSYLEDTAQPLCPKQLQINLTPFLENKAGDFVEDLWRMLLSAQANSLGVPQQLLDERKAELLRQRQALEAKTEQLRRPQAERKPQRSRSRSSSSHRHRHRRRH